MQDEVRDTILGHAEADNASKLAAAKQAMAGEQPTIDPAPDTRVSLVRGLWISGRFQKDAQVRELTGEDEEQISKTDPSNFLDTVVALGVESIGEQSLVGMSLPDRQGFLRGLLIGEREVLYLAIIKATFGNTRTMEFKCPWCETEQEVDFYIDTDFVPKKTSVEEAYSYTTRKGDRLTIRLATGMDQQYVLESKTSNMGAQNTMILSRCITHVNDGLIPDPQGYARKLGLSDRQAVLGLIIDNQPSIDLSEIETKCASCEREVPIQVGWANFFRT